MLILSFLRGASMVQARRILNIYTLPYIFVQNDESKLVQFISHKGVDKSVQPCYNKEKKER